GAAQAHRPDDDADSRCLGLLRRVRHSWSGRRRAGRDPLLRHLRDSTPDYRRALGLGRTAGGGAARPPRERGRAMTAPGTAFRDRLREFFYYPKLSENEDRVNDRDSFAAFLNQTPASSDI